MADFWLPVESDSSGKIEVRRIARALGMSRHDAFGRLLAVWFWFNAESLDGRILGGTLEDVDSIAERDGFAMSMVDVGWLKLRDDGIEQPGFHEHRQISQKELRKRGRAQKSKSKTDLLKVLEGTAKDRGEFIGWLRESFPELASPDAAPAQQSCAQSAATRRRRVEGEPEQKTQTNPAGRPDLSGGQEVAAASGERPLAADEQLEAAVGTYADPVPVEVNRLTSNLPDWPACEQYGDELVAPEVPPAGYFADGNAFEHLTARHLRSPQLLSEWHRRQLTLRDPPVGPSVAHLLLVLATAQLAGGKRVRNPVGLFVAAVSRGEWKCERALPAIVARWQRAELAGLIDSETKWLTEAAPSESPSVARALQELAPVV